MDKKTAQELIEKTFNNAFSEEQFTVFAKNLLNDFEDKHNQYSGNLVWDDYKEHINTYKRIGKYIDPDGEALDVLIVEVKSVTKLERARTALRNFVIKHQSKFEKDYALVAFYSKEDNGNDWRFSFIKLEYRSELDEEKGKVKTKKEFTPAKRYSFLVGKYEKAHTAKNQLLPLLQNISNNPTIEELEAAFSIEKVTDEFFNQYKDLYIKLYEHFENDNKVRAAIKEAGIDNARFTKKLLGQIVFLYFLQKKGWLGVAQNERWGTGKKRFVQELFEQAQKEKVNFFKDKLQYLFYEALAKERDNENSYYKRFDCRIPFLNGGLFEADYKWETANITIPEYIFRNKDKNKSGDEGTGVLDVFDRYNFTIKEDEPLDKEVAVDPEMLGKVFENMLDITERKSKGAFYTPREIVHYMCQESLIHYLDNTLDGKVEKKNIEQFIREGHFALENDERVANKGETKTYQYQLPESIRKNADLIDQKLSSIKICDPAIGSGAFPVGLLHELVNATLVLKPHLSYDYLTEKLKGFGFTHRESISDSRYIYRLKRHIIQESIYGVDIDSSAIDIARLRLWLSLVVDEDDLDPIETLPNLDYKIVAGNSLIGLPDGAMRNLQVEAELEKLKDKFYDITDENEKKALRKQINTKIRELLDSAETFACYKIDFDFKLYFSEVWYKKNSKDDPKPERDGFDVVIGNPPYKEFKLIKNVKSEYKTFTTNELYSFFFEKSIKSLLRSNGVISFITGSLYLKGMKFQPLRDYLLDASFPFTIEIKGDDVFENVQMPTCIFIGMKASEKWKLTDFIPGYNTLKKIENQTLALEKFVDIQRGFEIGRDKVLDNITKYPFITGSDVMPWKIKTLKYIDDATFQEFSKDEKYFNQPRILIRETGSVLTSLYLEEVIFCNRSLYSMIPKKGYGIETLKYINIVLNSEISQYYYSVRFKSETEIFPKIRIGQAKGLPIKNVELIDSSILILNDYIKNIDLEKEIQLSFFKHIANGIVFELYFPGEIKSAGKEILKHLGDLKPITDDMSEEKKLAIIQSEFERLYDPNHPVRFAIETLDSVEEVRIIKEALK